MGSVKHAFVQTVANASTALTSKVRGTKQTETGLR